MHQKGDQNEPGRAQGDQKAGKRRPEINAWERYPKRVPPGRSVVESAGPFWEPVWSYFGEKTGKNTSNKNIKKSMPEKYGKLEPKGPKSRPK